MKYILWIFRSMFRWIPVSMVITASEYLYAAFVPAVVTFISVNFFDSAAKVLNGEPAQNGLYLYAGLYLGVYLVNDFANFVRSIALNAGIYEKGTAFFCIELHEKLAKLPSINFENATRWRPPGHRPRIPVGKIAGAR